MTEITGLIFIILGVLTLFSRKTIVLKTLHSQKQLDKVVGNEESAVKLLQNAIYAI